MMLGHDYSKIFGPLYPPLGCYLEKIKPNERRFEPAAGVNLQAGPELPEQNGNERPLSGEERAAAAAAVLVRGEPRTA